MCGFAGFLGGTLADPGEAHAVLRRMAATMYTRGPDDEGLCFEPTANLGMVHRRLSIVDLSPAGHQPMASHSSRYVIALNGEIYNHQDLRAAIAQRGAEPPWRGHSDTESLLAGFDEWGVTETVKRSIGMFAIAVWDRKKREMTLARDRLGEKPLYYGTFPSPGGPTLLFGSDLAALRQHPAFRGEIDRGAVALLMRHNYIPAPYSIYKGVQKLEPGRMAVFSTGVFEPRIQTYWTAAEAVRAGLASPFTGSEREATDELEGLLGQAVQRQMMADVPLGAFLSGGIDSSTVVALMQARSSRPVRTFTIGFDESDYDEAVHAKAVARHLGTDHTELYVTPQEALQVIPKLPAIYSEPFADSSQIPTYLVSQLARQQVTVSLSGDAGDELFCGYNRYLLSNQWWGRLSRVPAPLRRTASRLVTSISPDRWNELFNRFAPRSQRNRNWGDKLHKAARVVSAPDMDSLYLGLVSHWRNPAEIVPRTIEPPTALNSPEGAFPGTAGIERMMALDTVSYLPDDILVKVDRAAMANSLETRVPFLDHNVVEFAWRLPLAYKLKGRQTKHVLRQVLYRHVPASLIERPKMGFGVPIDQWLRGPLREWARSLLDPARLRREGYFAPEEVGRKLDEHLSGQRNWQYQLWNVLMFQAWHESQRA